MVARLQSSLHSPPFKYLSQTTFNIKVKVGVSKHGQVSLLLWLLLINRLAAGMLNSSVQLEDWRSPDRAGRHTSLENSVSLFIIYPSTKVSYGNTCVIITGWEWLTTLRVQPLTFRYPWFKLERSIPEYEGRPEQGWGYASRFWVIFVYLFFYQFSWINKSSRKTQPYNRETAFIQLKPTVALIVKPAPFWFTGV